MAAVGIAVAEHADGRTGVGHRLVDALADIQRRHRHIRRGQHLGDSDEVRLQAVDLGAEALAEAAEA